MASELRFVVVGVAHGKGSTKSFAYVPKEGGRPRVKTMNDNPKTAGWASTIANCAALELQRAEHRGLVFDAGVELEACFHLPRPQALLTKSKAGRVFPHTKKPDLDKLARAVKDALTRVVWLDDSQVTDLFVHKRYCSAGEFPRVEIVVRAAVLEDPYAPRLV